MQSRTIVSLPYKQLASIHAESFNFHQQLEDSKKQNIRGYHTSCHPHRLLHGFSGTRTSLGGSAELKPLLGVGGLLRRIR